MSRPDYAEKIPNNVGLREDRRLQRALESWQPDFLSWWETMGPTLPTQDGYLRTAIDVRGEGWAALGHVPLIGYRWGGVPAGVAGSFGDLGPPRAGLGGAAAEPRRDRAVPVRPAEPVPGERGGGAPPLGDGVPAARLLRP